MIRARWVWYQYRLRTLLVGMVLIALLLVAYRAYLEPYRQQRETMELIRKLGGSYETAEASAWHRRMLGANLQDITLVNLADCDDPAAYLPAIERLPCLEALAVGGSEFCDEHLRRLQTLRTLRFLILDSANVSDNARGALCTARADLELYESQRKRIGYLQGMKIELKLRDESAASRIAQRLSKDFFGRPVSAVVDFHCLTPDEGMQAVGKLASLEKLEVSYIGLREEVLEHVKGLSKLKDLSVSGVRVTDDGLENIRGLPSLESLSISKTNATDAGFQHLSALTHLERLDLVDCAELTDASLVHVGSLRNLQVLWLSGTQVSDRGMEQLARLSNLAVLTLNDTRVGDVGLERLASLSSLKTLLVSRTQVTDAGLMHVGRMTGLLDLDLSETQVTDAGLAHLKGLTNLSQLRLNGTHVSDVGIAQLKTMTNLGELDLDNTSLGDDAIDDLAALKKLGSLSIGGTHVSAKGVADLKRALPGCHILGL